MDRQKSSSTREKEYTRSSSSFLDDIVSEWITVREMPHTSGVIQLEEGMDGQCQPEWWTIVCPNKCQQTTILIE